MSNLQNPLEALDQFLGPSALRGTQPDNDAERALMPPLQATTSAVYKLLAESSAAQNASMAVALAEGSKLDDLKQFLNEIDDGVTQIVQSKDPTKVGESDESNLALAASKLQWWWVKETLATQHSAVLAVENLIKMCENSSSQAEKLVDNAKEARDDLAKLQSDSIGMLTLQDKAKDKLHRVALNVMEAWLRKSTSGFARILIYNWRRNFDSADQTRSSSMMNQNMLLSEDLFLAQQATKEMEDRLRQSQAEKQRQDWILGDVSETHSRMAEFEDEHRRLTEENTQLKFETNRWKEDERSLESGKMRSEMQEMREAMAEIQMANAVMSDEYATIADAKFAAMDVATQKDKEILNLQGEVARLENVIKETGYVDAIMQEGVDLKKEIKELQEDAVAKRGKKLTLVQAEEAIKELDIQKTLTAEAVS